MAGKIRNMVNRSGRYHARLVVPKDLRGIVGKTELRSPLGGDYRQALKLLPGAVAQLQHQIALAEQQANAGKPQTTPARYPLAPDQIAQSHYMQRLAFDDEIRNSPDFHVFGQIGINDLLVQRLRDAIAGHVSDTELNKLVGAQVERFRAAGNLDAETGCTEWREIARALCHAELEALARAAERDEGDFSGTPTTPIIRDAQPPEKDDKRVSLTQLWSDYVNSRIQAGFMRDKGKRQLPVIESLRKHLRHNDAARVTKKDLMAWRGKLIIDLSPKTVNDIYLSTIRSLFAWAVDSDRLPVNVAVNVRQPKARKMYGRERGYTDAEAVKVLKASRSYEPKQDKFGRVYESDKIANMKRWVPIICAFTGARVSEITQLRKEDLRKDAGHWVARITPDAGTVKAGGYRDVPLHPQIIDEGFAEFVAEAESGPLFHNATDPEKFQRAAVITSNKLTYWLRVAKLRPEGLQPNHAWRHRFKTLCRELGVSDRVADAIQGHAAKSAADGYGDVTLKTKIDAISKMPFYDLKRVNDEPNH